MFLNMYSSSNPFPSSIHGFPASSCIFSGEEKDGSVYFSQNPFVSGEDCSFNHVPPPPPPPPAAIKESESSDNNHLKLSAADSLTRKRVVVSASKKDRHSKIFTAQGPRDRRVRLSIDISKKFFGLQDLLGFDKASKTLDWLFTKSKTAIKDLVEEMKHTSSSTTLLDQCEQVFMENGNHINIDNKKGKNKKKLSKSSSVVNINGNLKRNKKKPAAQIKQQKNTGFHVKLVARSQLRAEARARARERTIEKSRFKRLDNDDHDDKVDVLGGGDNRSSSYYLYLQSSATSGNQAQSSQSNHEVKIGELSFAEQKLPKPYSLLYNSRHNNYLDSKDSTSKIYRSTT